MNELVEAPPLGEPWICPKCTGVRGAHYLTCPTLKLPPGGTLKDLDRAGTAARQ